MKAWAPPLLISLAAFLGGLGCALFLSHKIERRAWSEFETFRDSPRHQAELAVRLHLANIAAAQRGDTTWIVRSNCLLMRSALPLVHPGAYEGAEKQREVKATIARAQELIVSLEAQGKCLTSGSR